MGRPSGICKKLEPWKDEVIRMYKIEEKSTHYISRELGEYYGVSVSSTLVSQCLKKWGVELRDRYSSERKAVSL